jgi:hypothetical protein
MTPSIESGPSEVVGAAIAMPVALEPAGPLPPSKGGIPASPFAARDEV